MTPGFPTASPPISHQPAWTANDLRSNPHAAADKARRVQGMFAAIARSYDLNNRVHSLGRDQAWRRRVVRECGVRPVDQVLDVACGTGDLTEAFAAAGAASVVGVDFTDEMLDIARLKSELRPARRTGCAPSYQWADAMDLPFGDATFDVVSIAFGIRNVSDPMRALREFARVLRPSGRVAVLEFSRPSNPIVRAFNALYCDRLMPLTATWLAGDRSGAYRYLPKSVQTFAQPSQLAAMLREAGFESIRHRSMTLGLCTATIAFRSCVAR
jgi:demethylmenaquinone methyltransferase / 2-methoxy-6-polyprenyl-1,4-benzoquinol methylase